jgi:hypothetical protein
MKLREKRHDMVTNIYLSMFRAIIRKLLAMHMMFCKLDRRARGRSLLCLGLGMDKGANNWGAGLLPCVVNHRMCYVGTDGGHGNCSVDCRRYQSKITETPLPRFRLTTAAACIPSCTGKLTEFQPKIVHNSVLYPVLNFPGFIFHLVILGGHGAP